LEIILVSETGASFGNDSLKILGNRKMGYREKFLKNQTIYKELNISVQFFNHYGIQELRN
jgi:hypothetical protein